MLGTPGHPIGNGIADVGRQEVHLRGQGHLVICGSSLEGFPWLDGHTAKPALLHFLIPGLDILGLV